MASCQAQEYTRLRNVVGRTLELSGPRGCLTMTRRGALASSRVMLFSRFTSLSGRGVATCFGPSLHGQRNNTGQMAERLGNLAINQKVAGSIPRLCKLRCVLRQGTSPYLPWGGCPWTHCKSLWIRASAK